MRDDEVIELVETLEPWRANLIVANRDPQRYADALGVVSDEDVLDSLRSWALLLQAAETNPARIPIEVALAPDFIAMTARARQLAAYEAAKRGIAAHEAMN